MKSRMTLLAASFAAAVGTLVLAAALMLAVQPRALQAQVGQNPTITPTFSGPTNAVQGTFFACPDAVGLQLTGTLIAGYDVYYQAFSGPAGSTAVTNVRQISLDGTFTFGERVALPAGTTLAAGATASARVFVARESNASSIDFEFALTDIQDGCGSLAPTGTTTSTDTGGTVGGTTGTTNTQAGVNLFAPNGQTLNPNLSLEPTVVVGARPSENFRSQTPGLIFAACDTDPLALPGLVYDNDSITVFWSWYTRTLEQMQDHLATAQYSVKMNTALLPDVQASEPERRGNRYYVFYTAPVGFLSPGHYEIEYRVTWSEPHFDGFEDFGPGTENPQDAGNCNFDVTLNPSGLFIDHSNIFFPTTYPVHNIFND